MCKLNAKSRTKFASVNAPLRSIYTWVRFRIRLAHFPKYKNNYILKNGLAYCEIALRNRTCKQAFRSQHKDQQQKIQHH
jgi:hypothetical protein